MLGESDKQEPAMQTSCVRHLIIVEDKHLGDYPEDGRHYSGSGQVLDLDSLMIYGQEGSDYPFKCRYFGDGCQVMALCQLGLRMWY